MRDIMLRAHSWAQAHRSREEGQGVVEYALVVGGVSVVLIGVPADFKPREATQKKKEKDWLPWAIGGIVVFFLILIVGSILTLNLLRRNGTVTATPADSPAPLVLITDTLFLPQPTATIVPTETPSPDVILPVSPTVTLTPWPTNTVAP